MADETLEDLDAADDVDDERWLFGELDDDQLVAARYAHQTRRQELQKP